MRWAPSLSHLEALLESTSKHLSYYQSDLVVVDWDAALIVDRPADFEESLFVMELANVQLEELEAYDQLIDTALERSYADLQRPPRIREHKRLLPHLREVRIDLARFSDELSNITKFFGDWHLARLYDTVSRRFHLPDWHRSIDEKLKTLDDLYPKMLKQEQNHRIGAVPGGLHCADVRDRHCPPAGGAGQIGQRGGGRVRIRAGGRGKTTGACLRDNPLAISRSVRNVTGCRPRSPFFSAVFHRHRPLLKLTDGGGLVSLCPHVLS